MENNRSIEQHDAIVNDINKFLLKKDCKFIDHKQWSLQRFRRLVEYNQSMRPKGQKKKISKGNFPTDLINKPFVYKIAEWDAYIGFIVTPDSRIKSLIYYKIKTLKGSLYVTFRSDDNSCIICYTAHFFDRYQERIKNQNIKKREEAIKHFLMQQLKDSKMVLLAEKITFGKSITCNMSNGIGLGTQLGNITLMTTFVDNSLINDKQQVMKDMSNVVPEKPGKYRFELGK